MNYANASSSLPQLRFQIDPAYLSGVAAGCALLFLSLVMTTMWATSKCGAERPQQLSIVLGTCMSNTGLALVLATVALPSHMGVHVAIIAYTFVQHLGVAMLSKRWNDMPEIKS